MCSPLPCALLPQLVRLAEKSFGAVPKAPPAGFSVPSDQAEFVGSDIRMRVRTPERRARMPACHLTRAAPLQYDDMPQAHLAIAFEGPGATSEHTFPMMVMQTILGSWDRTSPVGINSGSRLCHMVAEAKLAHSVTTFFNSYKVRSAQCTPRRLPRCRHRCRRGPHAPAGLGMHRTRACLACTA